MGVDKDKKLSAATELRRQAEERLRAKTTKLHPPRTKEATQRLVYELEVQQIEMEIQNAELRQAREEVETALEKYTDLYDFSPVGYFTIVRNGIISAVNLRGASLLGVERSRLIGRCFGPFVTEEYRLVFTAFLDIVFTSQSKEDCEVALLNRENFPLIVQIEAIATASGQECRFVLIDITERKLLDQVLQEKNIELESARAVAEKTNLTKSDFLANMSHELRTPLNSVIGFSEVLQDQMFGQINEKQQEYVNNILTSGKHLLSLINDILDLSKVESGKMELELSVFLLRESLDASMLLLREKALKGGIKLHLDLAPEDDVLIVADLRKLKHILFNLLSNAVKFTPAGGTVGVSVVRYGDFVEITVADTGMGIREEDIPKIFHPFTQLESVYTKGFEGTGLGLALNRLLIELLGGRIWVKSEIGAGSRFSFTIPLTQAATKELPATRSDTVPGSGNTVLVIEDDPLTLASLENVLLRKGYRALRASNGKDGVEMAQRDSPDLIVLDLVMPGMSGFDVADKLRNENAAANVPVLVLTSMDLSAADRARLAGKVWRIEGKGSLSTHEFLSLVESAVGPTVRQISV